MSIWRQSCPCHPTITDAWDNRCVLLHLAFTWILEITTQVARLEWQAFYPLSYHLGLGSDLEKNQVVGRIPTPSLLQPSLLLLRLCVLFVVSSRHHGYIVSIIPHSGYILRTLTNLKHYVSIATISPLLSGSSPYSPIQISHHPLVARHIDFWLSP